MPEFLTTSEAAALVRRSIWTIRRWLREGLFPRARKVKDGYLIPKQDLDALLDRGLDPHPPTKPRPVPSRRGFVDRWR